jgi:hypothetical protein
LQLGSIGGGTSWVPTTASASSTPSPDAAAKVHVMMALNIHDDSGGKLLECLVAATNICDVTNLQKCQFNLSPT